MVCKYIKPAVLNGLDMTNIEMTSMSQYMDMLRDRSKGTDGNS